MPRLLLIAGPNGSGKSTLTTAEILAHYQIPLERYINADLIAAQETGETTPEHERAAFHEARLLRQRYREEGVSFACETVFSHPSSLLDMQQCRAAGFEVVVLFVTTENPEINVARVVGRVQAGGHTVPEERIRSRYERGMRLLPRIVEEAHYANVFDNTGVRLHVYSFRSGQALPSNDPIPEFLRNRLYTPLMERITERHTLTHLFPDQVLPVEKSGTYEGPILWSGVHYTLQETAYGQIRHDNLLLIRTIPVEMKARIHYLDASGTIEIIPSRE